jgi:DNA-binding NarL/FixJ family response regulator
MERLLVIEDSTFFLNVITAGFKDESNVEISTAMTLADARECIEGATVPFTLALVDLRLPDANDGEAVDLTIDHGIPSVVFTSNFTTTFANAFSTRAFWISS